jgi:hypothetical protein
MTLRPILQTASKAIDDPLRALRHFGRLWVQVAIVVLVLTLSAVLAPRLPMASLVLMAAALGVAIFNARPSLGVIATLVALMLVRWVMATGTGTDLHAAIFMIPMLLSIWFVGMVARRRIQIVPSPLNLPLFAFVVSATLSFVAGNLPWNYFVERASLAAQAGGYAIFVLSAGMFLLVANQICNVTWLKVLTAFFLCCGALVMVGRAIQPLNSLPADVMAQKSGGSMFWTWVAALAGGQALFNRRLSRGPRLLLAMLGVAPFAIGFITGRSWASGWIPPLVVLAILITLWDWRLAVFLGAFGAICVFALYPELPSQILAGDSYSILTRGAAWEILYNNVFKISPVIGLGPANYYHYTPLFPIMGYYVEFNSHNNYMDILMQTGMIGMICFLWFMGRAGLWSWQIRNQIDDGFARGYAYACLAGVCGTLVAAALGDWVLPFVYNTGITGMRSSLIAWTFLGGLVLVGQPAMVQKAEAVS